MAMTEQGVVGREEELAALSDFLDGPPPPGILLLEGEAGIGKTTLWRQGIDLGERRGLRTLTCSPAESEIQLSFAAAGDLLGGELDEARRQLAQLEERGRALDNPWALSQAARCRGLLAAAEGELEAALPHFEEALREHERMPGPFERGRTLLALGQVQRRLKRKRAAREALTEALSIFDEVATPLWAEKARADVARIGGRAPAGRELTETESRVAALVAEGKSNKEVAAELFVNVNTIETHLSKIYAKLGVRSRGELTQRLR
jgi:DNA-binding CsgD family transcriptional regulator